MNLNEDPMLSKKIVFNMEEEKEILIGRSKKEENIQKKQIVINGVGILEQHAFFIYNLEDKTLYLKCPEMEGGENSFVNG